MSGVRPSDDSSPRPAEDAASRAAAGAAGGGTPYSEQVDYLSRLLDETDARAAALRPYLDSLRGSGLREYSAQAVLAVVGVALRSQFGDQPWVREVCSPVAAAICDDPVASERLARFWRRLMAQLDLPPQGGGA
ncbi:MAG: hypothetical protein HRU75_10990 [Planctomycetia bacterium]|nr:MAG: hypothetical protein HRU75_10990 [Planctomycetia bacterium]